MDKYTWVDVGSSYIPSELACAYLLAQLQAMDEITALRAAADASYRGLLGPLEGRGLLRLPRVPEGCATNYHNFYVLLNTGRARDDLADYLRTKGVGAAFHFVPLHTAPMGRGFGYRAGDLPVTEDVSGRLLRLPFFPGITAAEQSYVAWHVASFLGRGRSAARSAPRGPVAAPVESPVP